MGRRHLAAALAALVALALAACTSQPPPSMAGAPELHFALGIPEALGWFEERTLECLGPDAPTAEAREWLCWHEFEDESRLAVRITGSEEGVMQLVGVATGLTAEDSTAFLVSSVAAVVLAEADLDALERWALERRQDGGVIAIGPALVELRPHSGSRAIVVRPRA